MKQIRHFFLVFPTQCCFESDSDVRSVRNKGASSHLDLTQSTVKKSLSSSSNEQEPFTPGLKLLLEVRDSPSVQAGKVFQITPTGMVASPRQVVDGKTIIGGDDNECDIVLSRDADIGKMHCVIEYNAKNRAFYVKDLGDGNGTFIRVEGSRELRNGNVVNFGDSHARVMISDSTLSLQFYEGPLTDQEVTFLASQQPIGIGRTKDCLLRIDDSKLSINHCFLTYSLETSWVIRDGNGSKHSANGTW